MSDYPYPAKRSDEFSQSDYTNSGCQTECTGLIPTNPLSDAEFYSYEDVYGFLPPKPPEDETPQI